MTLASLPHYQYVRVRASLKFTQKVSPILAIWNAPTFPKRALRVREEGGGEGEVGETEQKSDRLVTSTSLTNNEVLFGSILESDSRFFLLS